MKRATVVLAVLVAASSAIAQPAPCTECAHGEQLIDRFGVQAVRSLGPELQALKLGDPLTAEQYAQVIALRDRTPALARLGAIDDTDLTAIAAALCKAGTGTCVTDTAHALTCIADRCEVNLPEKVHAKDVVTWDETCSRSITRRRSQALGLGFDWGNGWQGSKYPGDGRAWSLGIDARVRLGRRLGVVGRVDRVAGRDEAVDMDGNGADDMSTGSITRVDVLAGPSIVLDYTRYESTTRFVRLDLLGGYLATQSQAAESGPALGADLAFHLSAFRAGLRYVQGFGDAQDAQMLIGHLGIAIGSSPQYAYGGSDCSGGAGNNERSSRFAIGMDIPLGGYGISDELGYLATGLAGEVLFHTTPSIDLMARADLMVFPGYEDRDRVIHTAGMGGLRYDLGKDTSDSSRTGFFTTVLGGYTQGAGLTPSAAGSGPMLDLSVGWGGQGKEGAGYFRLHGRFGLGEDNREYRVIFLSAGFELRFDPSKWKDRV